MRREWIEMMFLLAYSLETQTSPSMRREWIEMFMNKIVKLYE